MPRCLFLFLLLPLAGCDLFGEDRPQRVDGRSVVQSETTGGLAEARGRWAEAGVAHYRFEYFRACECLASEVGPFVVTVRGAEVEDVEGLAGAPLPDGHVAFTVARLFDRIEAAFEQGADRVNVTYDAVLGFPIDVAIDYDLGVADEELLVEVLGFERLDG
jgi:hypothetical protein